MKQGVISIALKTPQKNKIENLYLQNFTSVSARWLYWFYIKLSPHILQQNCAHVWVDQNWIGLIDFTNFSDQDWIGFKFFGSGLDSY